MFCALVQWLCYAQLKLKSKKYGRRRNRGASRSKRKYRKQHPKMSITMQQCRCTPKLSPKLVFFGDLHHPKALLVFSSWSSAQPELQFPFLLLSRASPPFVSYDMDHLRLWRLERNHGPSLLVAVKTDIRRAGIVRCSCFRLRGRKHGYGEHTA